jgi:hypothetical protein
MGVGVWIQDIDNVRKYKNINLEAKQRTRETRELEQKGWS